MALLLVHGMGTGPEAWEPQVEAFAGSREVLTPALRLDRGFTIEREAQRLLDELPEGAHDVCGLSLGALVALALALARPERVRRLVLCAGFAALPRRYRVLQAVLGTVVPALPAGARGELAALDRGTLRAVFREGRRFDVSAGLARLTLPVLVLVGERDRPNRALSVALAAALPAARLELVPGAGHVANTDAPEAFTAALRAFLDD